MWVQRTAIRPVPSWAVVPEHAILQVTEELPLDSAESRRALDESFERFDRQQPELASWLVEELSQPMDDAAMALGYFAGVTVWLAFDRAYGASLGTVDRDAIAAASEQIALDEALRRSEPVEALDTDDVMALQQPHLVQFLNAHVEVTLEAQAESVDVDDVARSHRLVLVLLLALSHAVLPPDWHPARRPELLS